MSYNLFEHKTKNLPCYYCFVRMKLLLDCYFRKWKRKRERKCVICYLTSKGSNVRVGDTIGYHLPFLFFPTFSYKKKQVYLDHFQCVPMNIQ